MKTFLISLLLSVLLVTTLFSQTTILPYGATWKYLDNGTNQGTAWYGTSFNDASWASGPAELGYGDGGEATVIGYGPGPNKYIGTYFRKTFTVANVNAYTLYTLKVKRDDGIVVYVNGSEIYRDNMPAGTISYNTPASGAASDDGAAEMTSTYSVGASKLVSGSNTIAVYVCQNSSGSSDLSFNLQLEGSNGSVGGSAAKLTRGPYLQKATSTGIELRWRTDSLTNSKVYYGISLAYTDSVIVTTPTTEHVVTLTGLSPYTKYFYSVGSTTSILQGSAQNFFLTSPVYGTEGKYTFWAVGDCGANNTNQKNTLAQYNTYMGSNITNAWLLLGDNAYSGGLETEYSNNFFGVYQNSIMKNAPFWPVPGNHDYENNALKQDNHIMPYYDNFDVPTNGEAGGVASKTEAYYSYDYGNVHFIALDSYGEESNMRLYDTTGAQAVWLKKDLAANSNKWTVVYFHHPPYTMGSHNSDVEGDLVAVRGKLIKILERYRVDLIVCGHSHVYERSKLMKGHYGLESTFSANTHHLSQSTGKYDGSSNSCTYLKDSLHTLEGTVYVVSGSAGQLGGTGNAAWPHNAMTYSDDTHGGSFIFQVEGNRLDAKFLCADGVIRDQFTIIKGASKVRTIKITPGQNTVLKASWKGKYAWSHSSETTESVSVSPITNTTYVVTDEYQCVADTFKIAMDVISSVTITPAAYNFNVYPNPSGDQITLNFSLDKSALVSIELFDVLGRAVVLQEAEQLPGGTRELQFQKSKLRLDAGIYSLKMRVDDRQIVRTISFE